MPARNDASAVSKAARAVSRPVAEALVRMRLSARLPKTVVQPAQLPPEPQVYGGYNPDAKTVAEALGEPPVGSSAGGRRSRRNSPRRNASLDYRRVVKATFGRMPRYGTKRYDKAITVRKALEEAADGYLYVWQLVGRHYDTSNDTLTIHDLDVMVEKRLITINEEK